MMTAAARLRDELSHIESTEELQQFKEDDLEDFKDLMELNELEVLSWLETITDRIQNCIEEYNALER